MDDYKTVWCGNLSDQITEELLYELFLQAGPLERVKIPTDREGRKSNFGFITFKHDASVNYATQLLNGTRLYGKNINIKPRNNPQQSSSNTSHQENQNRYQHTEFNNMYVHEDSMQPKIYPLMPSNDGYPKDIMAIQNLLQMGQQMMHNNNSFEAQSPRQSENRRHNYNDRQRQNDRNRFNDTERHRQNYDNRHDSPNRNNHRRNDRDRSNSYNGRNNRRHDRF